MGGLELNTKTLVDNATRAYQDADYETAARIFGEAAAAFLAADDQLQSAEMKNNQSVAYLQTGNAQSAFDVVHGTASLFAVAGDFRREGLAFSNEASALQALGRLNEAMETYRLAAEALSRAGEDQMRATVMNALAGIQLRQGKLFDALLSMRIGLDGVKNPTLKQRILRRLYRLIVW